MKVLGLLSLLLALSWPTAVVMRSGSSIRHQLRGVCWNLQPDEEGARRNGGESGGSGGAEGGHPLTTHIIEP